MNNLKEILVTNFGEGIILEEIDGLMKTFIVSAEKIQAICLFLKSDPNCYFDSLACMVGIDNGPEKNSLEIVYNLYSIPYDLKIALKVTLLRNSGDEPLPKISTVSNIWHSANWEEREIFDLIGIDFVGHPDLRRILLPNDWQGHPLRKDYSHQAEYHGITVKYE
jgi:NADH-quinone oxidoreductase subunit C